MHTSPDSIRFETSHLHDGRIFSTGGERSCRCRIALGNSSIGEHEPEAFPVGSGSPREGIPGSIGRRTGEGPMGRTRTHRCPAENILPRVLGRHSTAFEAAPFRGRTCTRQEHGCLACVVPGRTDGIKDGSVHRRIRQKGGETSWSRSETVPGLVGRTWTHLSGCRSEHRRRKRTRAKDREDVS